MMTSSEMQKQLEPLAMDVKYSEFLSHFHFNLAVNFNRQSLLTLSVAALKNAEQAFSWGNQELYERLIDIANKLNAKAFATGVSDTGTLNSEMDRWGKSVKQIFNEINIPFNMSTTRLEELKDLDNNCYDMNQKVNNYKPESAEYSKQVYQDLFSSYSTSFDNKSNTYNLELYDVVFKKCHSKPELKEFLKIVENATTNFKNKDFRILSIIKPLIESLHGNNGGYVNLKHKSLNSSFGLRDKVNNYTKELIKYINNEITSAKLDLNCIDDITKYGRLSQVSRLENAKNLIINNGIFAYLATIPETLYYENEKTYYVNFNECSRLKEFSEHVKSESSPRAIVNHYNYIKNRNKDTLPYVKENWNALETNMNNKMTDYRIIISPIKPWEDSIEISLVAKRDNKPLKEWLGLGYAKFDTKSFKFDLDSLSFSPIEKLKNTENLIKFKLHSAHHCNENDIDKTIESLESKVREYFNQGCLPTDAFKKRIKEICNDISYHETFDSAVTKQYPNLLGEIAEEHIKRAKP